MFICRIIVGLVLATSALVASGAASSTAPAQSVKGGQRMRQESVKDGQRMQQHAQGVQKTRQEAIDSIVRNNPALRGAVIGISVKDMSGNELVSINPGARMVPASNTKLITTGTALHRLGGDWQFTTSLAYSGRIQDGTLSGDLYIIGGGDPTIGAVAKADGWIPTGFDQWTKLLKDNGIERVDGLIIGDGRAWDGGLEQTSWGYDDIGIYYGTGSDALCFYKNTVDFAISPGAEPGDPVCASQTFPDTPWMHFSNRSVTGPADSGNSLLLFTTDLAPYSELRGSFAINRKPKTEHFANKYGALTCALYFAKLLGSGTPAYMDRDGVVRGTDLEPLDLMADGEPVLIGSIPSPALRDICRETNRESDNFFAEAIYRALGKALAGQATYEGGKAAQDQVLKSLSLSGRDAILFDGSGLSRSNAVSAGFFTDFLLSMIASPGAKDFFLSIPRPGEGTLAGMLKGSARQNNFRLKSGSMTGVMCFSGYMTDDQGQPVAAISILVNGASAKNPVVRKAVESILENL